MDQAKSQKMNGRKDGTKIEECLATNKGTDAKIESLATVDGA